MGKTTDEMAQDKELICSLVTNINYLLDLLVDLDRAVAHGVLALAVVSVIRRTNESQAEQLRLLDGHRAQVKKLLLQEDAQAHAHSCTKPIASSSTHH